MAYRNITESDKKESDLDKHLHLEHQLDSHIKPIKIGDSISALAISDQDAKVENDLIVGGHFSSGKSITSGGNVTFNGDITFGAASGASTVYTKGNMVVDSGGNIDLYIEESDDYIRMIDTSGAVRFQFQVDDKEFRMLGTAADIGKIDIDTSAVMRIWNVTDGTTAHIKISAVDDIYLNAGGNNIYLNGGGESSGDTFAAGTTFGYFDFSTASTCKLLTAVDYHFYLRSSGTGDIVLDSGSGNFIAKKAGTDFSAANSSYAGMILGYTRLMGDGTNQDVFEIQDAITVEDSTHKITFKTPPSELVEIEVQVAINNASTDTLLTAGLSDNATYNSIGVEHEYDYLGLGFSDDEVDDHLHTVKWVLDADDLEAVGADNELWVGFGTGGATKTAYLTYGVRASHGLCTAPFIIKATALPATIYDGQ